MPRTRKPAISAKNIQGLKYFKRLQPLFASLHDIGVDPSGNRQLHYDQYASLILLFFFNPTLTSLRGLQQASCLEKVQDKLDCPRTSLGALQLRRPAPSMPKLCNVSSANSLKKPCRCTPARRPKSCAA